MSILKFSLFTIGHQNRLKSFSVYLPCTLQINSLFANGEFVLAVGSMANVSITELQGQVVSQADVDPPTIESMQDANDSSDAYSLSSEGSELDEITNEDDMEREAREEKERELVLQAAGLIVTQEAEQPPRVVRSRSIRKHRPPPAAPKRLSKLSNTVPKDLPPVPDSDPLDSTARLDDAFDRYEAFRLAHGNLNRLSVASVDTGPPSPGLSPSSSIAPSLSRDSDSRGHSALLNFLGRKSPMNESERRSMPNISAPLLISPTPPSRENSPAFGTVSITTHATFHILNVVFSVSVLGKPGGQDSS